MKNKFKYISFFILFICIMFGFKVDVGAEKCEYTQGFLYDVDEPWGVGFLDGVGTNPYARLRAVAGKIGMENALDNYVPSFYDGLKNLDITIGKKKIHNYYNSAQVRDKMFTMSFSFETGNVVVDEVSFEYYSGNPGELYNKVYNYSSKVVPTSFNYDECPSAIALNYDANNDVFIVHPGYYLASYDYDMLKLIAAANGSVDNPNIILFNQKMLVNEAGNVQDSFVLLNAISCTIDGWSAGVMNDDMAEVKAIIDKASVNDSYNIRNIYSDIIALSEEDAKKTLDKISKGETAFADKERIIVAYINSLPYFKEKSAEAAKAAIERDKDVLEKYDDSFENVDECLKNAYSTDDVKTATAQYMLYDKEYQGLYIEAMLNLLEIFTDDNIDSFFDANQEINYIDGLYNSENCRYVSPDSSRRACVEGLINADINKLDCESLVSKEKLTPSERILKDSLSKYCKIPEYNCYRYNCDNAKKNNNVSDKVSELYDGNTDAQNKVNDALNSFYEDLITHTGIKIESNLCKIFDGSLGTYIKLGINVIRIGGPILVIILTGFDAMKAITSMKEDENKKFYNRLKVRLICVFLLIIIPTIVKFLLNLFFFGTCENEVI